MLETEFNYEINTEKRKDKIEIYNLKNLECQKDFKDYTSKSNMLSSIFARD